MATQAGIGVLIGLGIGSGVTAFLMKRIIRRQDNALQQSLNRLNRIQDDHAQDLNAALAKAEADYEQQLAAKIERYQDTHEEQLTELEAEYEARIAALLGVNILASDDEPATGTPVETASPDSLAETAAVAGDVTSPSVNNADNAFIPAIPDPWTEVSSSPVATAAAPENIPANEPEPEPEATLTPVAAPSPVKPDSSVERAQTAAALGQAAAINRKDAVRAVPQLGKLVKDDDADVRLAAVTALQESGSIKAIPFLRQALRDTDNRIVAAASAALSRFKGSKKAAPKAKAAKKKRRR